MEIDWNVEAEWDINEEFNPYLLPYTIYTSVSGIVRHDIYNYIVIPQNGD